MPTSWCAVSFVYMMAEDIRHALLAVESIHAVTIRVGDPCAAPAIETGVNAGTPFAEAFAAEQRLRPDIHPPPAHPLRPCLLAAMRDAQTRPLPRMLFPALCYAHADSDAGTRRSG